MKYEQALKIAKKVMNRHPDYILCGSVALILAGVLPERDVGDVDFIVPKDNFTKTMIEDLAYKGTNIKMGYKAYIERIAMFEHYNIFMFDNTEKIKTKVIGGLTIQDPENILKFKNLYARDKDLKDLNAIKNKTTAVKVKKSWWKL